MFERELQGPAPIATADRLVFRVPSDRDPARFYRVDLEANGGNGACACRDHATRRQPAINAGGSPFLSDAATCKHVRRCWAYIFIACAQRIGTQPSEPKP